MKPPMLYWLALRGISLGVPRAQRREWLAEWAAELWYVREAVALTHPSRRRHAEMASFCRGAVEDARFLRGAGEAPRVAASSSAIACAGLVGALALLGFGLAQVLPGVRRVTQPPAYRVPANVVRITPASSSQAMPLGTVRSLAGRPQHIFSDLAFYEPMVRSVHAARFGSPTLRIARSSGNLLALLDVPVAFAGPPGAEEPRLILSEAAWRLHFGASTAIFGSTWRVGLQQARVAGVVLDGALLPAETFDGWLLLPAGAAAKLPDTTGVVLLGRIAPQTDPGPTAQSRWQLTVPDDLAPMVYDCTTLVPRRVGIVGVFLFAAMLALLSLPATTALSLGEYSVQHVSLPWTANLPRWLFLGAKIALSLTAIYFGSLDLAYGIAWTAPNTPQYLHLVAAFSATLFALRWALRDQRQRCPVCLGKLTCPARVGEPSRNFLSWNGTELICEGGHGFLHVPELPTSWFGAPRWLHLDPTWRSLFLGPA